MSGISLMAMRPQSGYPTADVMHEHLPRDNRHGEDVSVHLSRSHLVHMRLTTTPGDRPNVAGIDDRKGVAKQAPQHGRYLIHQCPASHGLHNERRAVVGDICAESNISLPVAVMHAPQRLVSALGGARHPSRLVYDRSL